ncbi:MAG: hypothetical protein LBC56_08550 [Oscillospiraceae bacterium]|jgi:hypothetical protein|nr:hypothetical protein [Oscillospiraceae bacterium]
MIENFIKALEKNLEVAQGQERPARPAKMPEAEPSPPETKKRVNPELAEPEAKKRGGPEFGGPEIKPQDYSIDIIEESAPQKFPEEPREEAPEEASLPPLSRDYGLCYSRYLGETEALY